MNRPTLSLPSNSAFSLWLGFLVALACVLSCSFSECVAAPGGFFSEPEVQYISPHSPRSIAGGNGRFVAVETRGVILSSANGIDWEQQMFPTIRLWAVAYGGGQFLVLASNANFTETFTLTSPDGLVWTSRRSDLPGANPVGLAYGNGVFVAVDLFHSHTSQDGLTWTTRNRSFGASDIVFGNGKFVAFNEYSDVPLLVSEDGLNWTEVRRFDHERISSVASGAGVFVASVASRLWRSEDGLNWTNLPSPAADDTHFLSQVAFANGLFLLSTARYGYSVGPEPAPFYTSTDGLTWTRQPPSAVAPQGPIANADGILISLDSPGREYPEVARRLIRSTDAVSWSRVLFPNGFGVYFTASTFWKDRFVVLGYDRDTSVVGESTDGRSWVFRRLFGRYRLASLIGTDDLLIAAGGIPARLPGEPRPSGGVLLVSRDRTNWTNVAIEPGPALNALGRAPEQIVAVGDRGRILSSPDGEKWSERFWPNSLDLVDVEFGNGMFVAVGGSRSTYESSILLSSPNGLTWTQRGPAAGNILLGVAFGSGRFLVGRWNGPNLISNNGIDWIEHPSTGAPATASVNLSSITSAEYIGGWFILRMGGFMVWTAWTSADLRDWSKLAAFNAEYVPLGHDAHGEVQSQMAFDGRTVVLTAAQHLIRFDLQGHPFEVSVVSSPGTASELGELGAFTVRRTGSTTLELPVNLTISGTAEEGTDYAAISQPVVIPAGQHSLPLAIRPSFDAVLEPTESIIVQVQPGENYGIGDEVSATVLIHDSGTAPRLRPSAVSRGEDGSVRLTIEVPVPGLCTIERSADLKEWQAVDSVQSNTALLEFSDSPGADRQRFYRVRLQPSR